MIFDQQQISCQKQLSALASSVFPQSKSNFFNRLINTLSPFKKRIYGIYLHGGVGQGKTMLMQQFYQQITLPKKMLHYQHFMQIMHEQIHQLRQRKEKYLIQKLAKDLAKKYCLLCIDELDIKDITDATLITNLFKLLQKKSVFIFVTTNSSPDNLYQDGLQREIIIPFIQTLKEQFSIIHLQAERDYRFNSLKQLENRIIFPDNQQNQQIFQTIIDNICTKDLLTNFNIQLSGRNINFAETYNNILITNFNELFTRPLSYLDYVEITKKFAIIIVDQVRLIEEDEDNLIIRLINFIDQAYFNRILLFMKMSAIPKKLYVQGRYINEFQRTISRLNEMNAKNYLSKI